jgi:prepilin-type N-terminal cleavage/methylation domain-containing protein
MHKNHPCRSAFTLVELLVSISIIAVLASLGFAATAAVKRAGNQTREISAGRQLIAAYLLAASSNNGELLPAYEGDSVASNESGDTLRGPAANRYPWRLAPFLDNKIFGTLLVNGQEELGRDAKRELLDYLVSFAPTFGINGTFVGGNFSGSFAPGGLSEKKFGKVCVRRVTDPVSPQRLIVFCSAHYNGLDSKPYLGHHFVSAPNERYKIWTDAPFSEDIEANKFGHVHPRFDGRAVVVMFDGHTELLTIEQLRDMRYWSNQAAENDDPNFRIGQ